MALEDLKETIRDRLEYHPDSGLVTSKINYGRHCIGKPVGTLVHGRLRVIIDKQQISLCKVIWVLLYNRWPLDGYEIDHRNRIKTDNRRDNLREITMYENRAKFELDNPMSRENRSKYGSH